MTEYVGEEQPPPLPRSKEQSFSILRDCLKVVSGSSFVSDGLRNMQISIQEMPPKASSTDQTLSNHFKHFMWEVVKELWVKGAVYATLWLRGGAGIYHSTLLYHTHHITTYGCEMVQVLHTALKDSKHNTHHDMVVRWCRSCSHHYLIAYIRYELTFPRWCRCPSHHGWLTIGQSLGPSRKLVVPWKCGPRLHRLLYSPRGTQPKIQSGTKPGDEQNRGCYNSC